MKSLQQQEDEANGSAQAFIRGYTVTAQCYT